MPVFRTSRENCTTVAAIAAAVALGFPYSSSYAAVLQVSPINLFVIAPNKAGAVNLSNPAKNAARLQIRIFRWSQKNGEEILEPSREVIANPPSMSIPAEKTYTIRVARIAQVPVSAEESYRLIIDELPEPIDPNVPNQGVRMLLRTSLPVFFHTKQAVPKIAWRLWNKDGKLHLEATNSGNRHIKLVGLAVEGPQGVTKFITAGTNAYVLPGSTLRYEAQPGGPAHAVGTPVTITTIKATPLDEVRQPITVAAGP